MSLQALSTLLLSDVTQLDQDIKRGLTYAAQDFEKAFSSGSIEDLRKRQVRREYLEPLCILVADMTSGTKTESFILSWLEKSREEIYRELTQGRLKGRSNCPWHNLNHEYRMEVYAALLPTLSNYIRVYNQ